jgi:Acyl-CoA dehydrogenases
MEGIWLSYGRNYFSQDRPLQLFLEHLGFRHKGSLEGLGSYVSTRMMPEAYHIDRHARPSLIKWSVRGEELNEVLVSSGHIRTLYDLLGFGVVSKALTGEADLMYHFVSGYVISDAGLFCSVTLTMQTAYGLGKYGDEATRSAYLPHFLREERPWMGATFYTELGAGSDLGGLETVAERAGDGTWRLKGLKYFASNAGLANAAIVTAKPAPVRYGARAVATFFAPALRPDGRPNWRLLRLKEKLGTITVPTGEVELNGTLAHILSTPENGIYVALEILTLARIDNSLAGLGLARKALWEVYLYGRERRAFGRRLVDHPLYLRDLVEMEARLQANLLLSLVTARSFTEVSDERPPYSPNYHAARLLTHLTKNMAAWTSIDLTRYSMELMGGIGFLEEFPMAKLHRDALVTSIWEGTSNVHSLDMAEAFYSKEAGWNLLEDLNARISGLSDQEARRKLSAALEGVRDEAATAVRDGVELHAKRLLTLLGRLISATLYQEWAESSGEEWATAMSRVYLLTDVLGRDVDSDLVRRASYGLAWMG